MPRTLISGRLGKVLASPTRLTGRCTIKAVQGTGWATLITNVPYRRDAPQAQLALVAGGALTQQHAIFQFDPAVIPAVTRGSHIIDESGTTWLAVGDSSTTEDLLTVVDAVRQG